jgi:PAS domain S-box-containing protein
MGVSEPLIQTSLLGEAVEHGPAAVFVADEEGRYVAVNQAACILLGYSRQELLAMHVAEIARSDESAQAWETMRTSGTSVGTTLLTRKDGRTVSFTYVAGATVVAGMSVYVAAGVAVGS